MADPKQGRVFFEHLDPLRFLAAFMVLILHGYESYQGAFGQLSIFTVGDTQELTGFGEFGNQFLLNMGLGVDVFFLISGFLITFLLLEERKRFGKIHIGKFILRRTLRIWPLYFLILLTAPLYLGWLDLPDPNYVSNALFISNFEAISINNWSQPFPHFWSICVEEHFYLVWPFIIALIPTKWLGQVMLALIAFSIGFRIYSVYSLDYAWFTQFLHTFSRMDVLVLGSLGGYYYWKKPFQFNLGRTGRLAILAILIMALSIESINYLDGPYLAGFKKYIYISTLALLMLDYNFNSKFTHRIKNGSVIHYLGKISYGMYMYGNILVVLVLRRIMINNHMDNPFVFFSILIGMSILVPIISYELVEKQFLKISKKFKRIETRK